MKESTYEMPNGAQVTFCELTVDETYAMAKFVMDCICIPWVDTYTEFDGVLREILYRCAKGRDMTAEQAIRLADKYERYFHYGLPKFPKIKDGGRLHAPKELHGTEATLWLQTEIARIWHEVWQEHTEIRRKGGLWVLPGSKPDEVYLQMQSKREDAFWVEVDQKQAEYQISRQEAIILVSDYMPRAESEQQLPDPTIDNS
jgi:hypothetical protein